MKNLNQFKVEEISKMEAKTCNAGYWAALLNYLLQKSAEYQAFKEATGSEVNVN